jgi:hypothetical protein
MKIIYCRFRYIDNYDISFVSKSFKDFLTTIDLYVKKFEKKTSKFLKEKIFYYRSILGLPFFYNFEFIFLKKIIYKIILLLRK